MRRTRHPAVSARDSSKNRRFFFQRASFPLRDAPTLEIERFWNTRTRSAIHPDHRWNCAGPFNIAGRVTSLAIHPADPNFWVAGSAAGGVWVSSDAGASWNQTWSRFATQSIGAVGWIELWDWCVVVATGEANMSADHYPGSGLYCSMDKGLTWIDLLGQPVGSSLAEDIRRQPRRIGCLAFGKGLQRPRQPSGEAFAVRHFHSARFSLRQVGNRGFLTGLSAGQGALVFSLGELTGNVWLEENGR